MAAAASLSACGDPESSTTASATQSGPPTKAYFLSQADRICHSFESQIEAGGDQLFTGHRKPDPARLRRFALRLAAPKLEAEIGAIRALGAPRGDEAEVEAILGAAERGVREIRRDPESLASGQPPAGLKESGRLAARYGSRECGAQ